MSNEVNSSTVNSVSETAVCRNNIEALRWLQEKAGEAKRERRQERRQDFRPDYRRQREVQNCPEQLEKREIYINAGLAVQLEANEQKVEKVLQEVKKAQERVPATPVKEDRPMSNRQRRKLAWIEKIKARKEARAAKHISKEASPKEVTVQETYRHPNAPVKKEDVRPRGKQQAVTDGGMYVMAFLNEDVRKYHILVVDGIKKESMHVRMFVTATALVENNAAVVELEDNQTEADISMEEVSKAVFLPLKQDMRTFDLVTGVEQVWLDTVCLLTRGN